MLFHIFSHAYHHQYDQPKIGEIIKTSGEFNPYFRTIENSATCPRNDVSQRDVMIHYAKMLREYVFENVRCSLYPHYPSRFRCLWFAKSLEDARYWFSRIPHHGEKVILEVIPQDGAILFEAHEGYLTNNLENAALIRLRALAYWSGALTEAGKTEVLGEGAFKVVEVHA
ncbi:DUF2441 domain-containing protein [Pseudomonas sp. BGM005]|nr:DUF2441 domain-containing protein [Pseudomonas sp. BG5]